MTVIILFAHKHNKTLKRKRAGWTRQTDITITAGREYKGKNTKH